MLKTIFYPRCTVARDVILCALNSTDHIYLLHSVGIDAHIFGLFSNLIKLHFCSSYAVDIGYLCIGLRWRRFVFSIIVLSWAL